jgi:hypothetical protein
MKEVIVDVDNTICDFAPVFYDELRKINPEIPKCSNWNEWNFYNGYMTNEEFYDAAHLAQMRIMECKPLQMSEYFLKMLSIRFKVVIASHRQDESRDLLIEWMKLHNLVYDDIHISYDKTQIFNGVTAVIVDDSPTTLKIAHDKGIIATGLELPWNKDMRDCVYLGKDLVDVLSYIMRATVKN